jgi:YhcH/YjgK/YiaL family protein
MIVDQISNEKMYRSLGARFAQALGYLTETDLAELPPGKQTIHGEELFALVNDYVTQPPEKCRFEAHRRYADIQLMVRGIERIGVANLANMAVDEPYSPERDVAFFHGQGDQITLPAGTFAVFFPHDAHQPGIAVNQPLQCRKVVIKVLLGD